jgi:hypothetical protein
VANLRHKGSPGFLWSCPRHSSRARARRRSLFCFGKAATPARWRRRLRALALGYNVLLPRPARPRPERRRHLHARLPRKDDLALTSPRRRKALASTPTRLGIPPAPPDPVASVRRGSSRRANLAQSPSLISSQWRHYLSRATRVPGPMLDLTTLGDPPCDRIAGSSVSPTDGRLERVDPMAAVSRVTAVLLVHGTEIARSAHFTQRLAAASAAWRGLERRRDCHHADEPEANGEARLRPEVGGVLPELPAGLSPKSRSQVPGHGFTTWDLGLWTGSAACGLRTPLQLPHAAGHGVLCSRLAVIRRPARASCRETTSRPRPQTSAGQVPVLVQGSR